MGCYLFNYSKYRGRIFRWYSENRTAHAKVQYLTRHCGFHPVAFFPNKDVFYGKPESDILALCYDLRALSDLRSPKVPRLIPEAGMPFLHADRIYHLGEFDVPGSLPALDFNKVGDMISRFRVRVSKDAFGYKHYTMCIEGSDSRLSFVHSPQVHNIEKITYSVADHNQLFMLARELVRYSFRLGVRYLEVFVSAYMPEHQKIFLDLGLVPRGYVPSWTYNVEKGYFEDCIVFNYFHGNIDPDIQLLDEERELVRCLDLGTGGPAKKGASRHLW